MRDVGDQPLPRPIISHRRLSAGAACNQLFGGEIAGARGCSGQLDGVDADMTRSPEAEMMTSDYPSGKGLGPLSRFLRKGGPLLPGRLWVYQAQIPVGPPRFLHTG
jgi:hypothetical protein